MTRKAESRDAARLRSTAWPSGTVPVLYTVMDRETLAQAPPADEPYYLPTGDEVSVFEHCHERKLPVLIKGPTGCGKTRFIEHMAWRLRRPLVTVSCHDDLTSSDLTGRWIVRGDETHWVDGPLAAAVRVGAICYLDEIVEARQDTTVVIHPLADDRRILSLERKGELLHAEAGFQLVMSFNPQQQHALKQLKPSTRQRFVTLTFNYPRPPAEATIVVTETGIDRRLADKLVALATKVRRLRDEGLGEGPGTRTVVSAARLVVAGTPPRLAARAAMADPLTEDTELLGAIEELIDADL